MTDYYVDSVNGSDSNIGSQSAPFQTLAAVEAVATNNDKVGLVAGSEWREELDLSSLTGVLVSGVGDFSSDGLPVVRGDDTILDTWDDSSDRADANTNVYSLASRSYTFSLGQQAIPPHIYEDDLILTWVADLATCQSTPGSFYHTGTDSDVTNITVYIHPRGSTNANSDGKTYSETVRTWCVRVGDNSTVRAVWGKNQAHDNGAINGGDNCTFDACLATGSPIHSILAASGSMSSCVGWLDEADGRTGAAMLEFYRASGSGYSASFDTCIGVVGSGDVSEATAIFTHTSGANYDEVNATDCSAQKGGIKFQDVDTSTVTRPYIVSGASTFEGVTSVIDPHFSHPSGLGELTRCITAVNDITVDGLRANFDSDFDEVVYGNEADQDIIITNSVVYDNAGSGVREVALMTGVGTLTSTGNIYHATASGGTNCNVINTSSASSTLVADNNVYYPASFRKPRFTVGGTGYDDVAAYTTAVDPQEDSSTTGDAGFSDPANGDFSLSSPPANGAGLERDSVSYTPIPASKSAAEAWVISRAGTIAALSSKRGGKSRRSKRRRSFVELPDKTLVEVFSQEDAEFVLQQFREQNDD